MPTSNHTKYTMRERDVPTIFEVEAATVRSRGQAGEPPARVSYLMPEEARLRLRETTNSPYWAQVALGFPILMAPAPFALVCFDKDADLYARFEKARKNDGLGRKRFGFYPYQLDNAPSPGRQNTIPPIGLVDFMTIAALKRAQELLPEFSAIDASMLDEQAHYLIFMSGLLATDDHSQKSQPAARCHDMGLALANVQNGKEG